VPDAGRRRLLPAGLSVVVAPAAVPVVPAGLRNAGTAIAADNASSPTILLMATPIPFVSFFPFSS